MEEWDEDEKAVLKRLQRKLENDPSFSDHEEELLREMISVYRGIRAWGRLTRLIVVSLAALAAAATAWDVLSLKVKAWFGL